MSIVIKGIDLPTEDNVIFIGITKTGKCGMEVRQNEYMLMDYAEAIQIPKGHGILVEELYPGELKAKQPVGSFIMYRSADEDSYRFILEAEG